MQLEKPLGFFAIFCAAMLTCAALLACGDDGTQPEEITLADFAGSWSAQSYEVTNSAMPVISLEIISLGATFGWDVDGLGNFVGTAFIPAALAGQDLNLNFQGNFDLVAQDSLIINFVPEIPPFLTETRAEFQLVGNTLTLIDSNTIFDFDQDGSDEAAIFEGTFIRN